MDLTNRWIAFLKQAKQSFWFELDLNVRKRIKNDMTMCLVKQLNFNIWGSCQTWVIISDGSGSGQPSLVWVWKISHKNPKFFTIFPFGSKKSPWVGSNSTRVIDGSASYLLQVKSRFRLGQGPSLVIVWGLWPWGARV